MGIDPVSLAITAAMMAANMALTMTRKIEGPRLDDLKFSVADYGTPCNYFKGKRRFQGNSIIWAEPLKEVKKKHKTKGGKYNEYTYFGTFAVIVADHEIEAVSRIWADKHIIYNVVGAGPISPALVISNALGKTDTNGLNFEEHIRFYYGTEDQMPDPRMLATVEAEHGAGSCPAYRGVSYVVFEEVPLEKFGNRIPQISIEAITTSTTAFPYETVESPIAGFSRLWGFSFSPDYSRFVYGQADEYAIFDTAARLPILSGALHYPDGFQGYLINSYGVANDGTIYTVGQPTDGDHEYSIIAFDPDGVGVGRSVGEIAQSAGTGASSGIRVLTSGGGSYICLTAFANQRVARIGSTAIETDDYFTGGFIPTAYFKIGDDIWCCGARQNSTGPIRFLRVVSTGEGFPEDNAFEVDTGVSFSGVVRVDAAAADGDKLIVAAANQLFTIDLNTLTIVDQITASLDPYNVDAQFQGVLPSSHSIWLGTKQYSTDDLSVLRTVDLDDWLVGGGDGIIYEPITQALVSSPSSDDTMITWRFLNRVDSSGVPLQEIVEDVTSRVGIDPADVDASDLDQMIPGWSWTHGSGRGILEPLLDAYDSIVRPHGFQLEFLKLGGASQGTIDVGEFVKQDARYKVKLAQDTDLPRRATFSFADIDSDQQSNSVVVQRPLDTVDGVRETAINMATLAEDVDMARQLTERWFRRQWFGRKELENALTPQRLKLEPGDVWTSNLDGETLQARLTKMTIGADGAIACEWKRDDPSIAVLSGTSGAPMDGRAPSTIFVPQVSKGFGLDLPLLRDADNNINPIIYLGAGPYTSAGVWTGATFYRSLDDGSTYEEDFGGIASTAPMTWGYAHDALGDADPWVWDRGNSVTVKMQYGTLVSTTEDVCNATATANMAVIGDEIVQFTTATLNIDGTWTISGLKRGRRGTEWACGHHGAGDRFVLLDRIAIGQLGASDVGDVEYFKAVTSGRDPTSAFPIKINGRPQYYAIDSYDYDPYEGRSLRPYAVANIVATKDDPSTNDWTLTFRRRTRIGGDWTGGFSAPIGEAAELYKLDITGRTLTGDFESTIFRTISASSESITWTEAQQIADGATPGHHFYFRIYQWSDTVGRGFSRFYHCTSDGAIVEVDRAYVDLTREP